MESNNQNWDIKGRAILTFFLVVIMIVILFVWIYGMNMNGVPV